jgi:hypothetical protein
MSPLPLGERLRKLLLANPLGMTVSQMSVADGTPMDTIIGALYRNYGFYIGGWQKADTGKYRAIWCLVRVPNDAPRPSHAEVVSDQEDAIKQRKSEDRKRRQQEARDLARRVRAEFKAKREADKAAEKIRKAEARELRKRMLAEAKAQRKFKAPVAVWTPPDDNDTTIKTRWVTPPPWMERRA